MLKLYVNFILQAQNHISAQVKFWYYSIFSTLCTTRGMNTSLFFVTFSCTHPEASADFSQCDAIQKFSAKPSVLGFDEQKCLARIPVAPSGTLQLPLEQVNYQLNNSSLSKNPFSSASR